MKYFLKKQNKFEGFTLIEVLVAVALFSTIITLAIGALFAAQKVSSRLSANQTILDGMNLSFEIMTRDIRYGTIFNCDTLIPIDATSSLKRKSCPFNLATNPGTTIVFKPVDAVDPDDRVGYYATSSKIYKWSYISHNLEEPKPITSDDVIIDTLHFYITGANTTQQAVDNGNTENFGGVTDTLQPVINVMATGKTSVLKEASEKVRFQLQTTIAPSGIDN